MASMWNSFFLPLKAHIFTQVLTTSKPLHVGRTSVASEHSIRTHLLSRSLQEVKPYTRACYTMVTSEHSRNRDAAHKEEHPGLLLIFTDLGGLVHLLFQVAFSAENQLS